MVSLYHARWNTYKLTMKESGVIGGEWPFACTEVSSEKEARGEENF
ncbi:hypothetical protein [Okeania sp. SIO2B3]|nr:hypothetical protein [Okeania sp. SIO2B3]NET43036.1 hypothetical protein [Okeania sp. SIO2B3]